MIDRDALNVWYEQRLVGRLWRDNTDRMGFRYDTDWLDQGFRLSVRLPLTDAPFRPEERAAHFFFANLLPEGDARNRLLRARRLPDSDFILLREFGGDCAGALSILPAESAPESAAGHIALSDDMLHRLVLQRGGAAYADDVPEPRPRLSLAGAQDKCPVYLHEGRYHLPQGTAASTHILKFRVPGFANVPLYEAFMCRLAHSMGLAVPETRLADIRGERFLVVTRYDRFRDSDRVRRLHQEDLLQALGAAYRDKYQAFGGPGLADCVAVIREVSEQPVTDIRALVRWQAFNVLAGNSDGHAKNLALVQVEPGGNRWRLAPFYDLVCTRAIRQVGKDLAMAVGGESNPDRVGVEHWRRLAGDCGLAPRFVLNTVSGIAESLLTNLRTVRERFESEHGAAPALQRIGTVVRKQCRRILHPRNEGDGSRPAPE